MESFEMNKIMSDKENVSSTVRKGKFIESKSNVGKKGLSLNAETHATLTRASVQKSFISTTEFKVHCDSEQDSRSRPQKRISRKEIRAKQDSKVTGKISTLSPKETLERKKYTTVHGLHRSRSAANWNRFFSDEKNKAKNLPRRASSETRRTPLHSAATIVSPKIKVPLTDDVKRRTFVSIEMWKNKMRKNTDIVPKNYIKKHSNVLNIDRGNIKNKLQENTITDNCSKIHEKSSAIFSSTLNEETAQNLMINLQKNSEILMLGVSSATALKCLTNKDTTNVQDNSFSSIQENLNAKIVTSPNISAAEHLMMIVKEYSKKHIEYDYLEDTPNTERIREELAPSLSSRFLRENVNAEQRKIIVRYLIHLGIRCNYSTLIIYQTVKLFDLAIDRILVETNNIQLLSLSCLWIILKRETTNYPSATEILRLAKDLYISQEKLLLMYETKILSAVKFNIRFADPYSLLFYYIKSMKKHVINSTDIPCIYFCGSYMIDLTMLDETSCDTSESIRALAAVNLSLHFMYWTNVAQVYRQFQESRHLTEWEKRTLKSMKKNMISQVLKSENENSDFYIVYKKYASCQYMKISSFLLDKVKKFLQQNVQEQI